MLTELYKYELQCAYYILHKTKRGLVTGHELHALKGQCYGGSIFPPLTPNLEVKYLGDLTFGSGDLRVLVILSRPSGQGTFESWFRPSGQGTFESWLFYLPDEYVCSVEPVPSEKKTCICIQIATL